MSKKEIKFNDGLVDRHFTPEWKESGIICMDRVPDLVASLVTHRTEMVDYIEALHDKIDWILKTNNCCDIPSCLTANCTSDHK